MRVGALPQEHASPKSDKAPLEAVGRISGDSVGKLHRQSARLSNKKIATIHNRLIFSDGAMRQGPNAKRSRGRGNGRKQNVPLRLQTLDSSGPNGKLRGNAYQLHEKYLALARDAHSSGDRIAAENYYQHAEHYFRIINSNGSMPRHEFDAFAGENVDGEQPEVRPAPAQPQAPPQSTPPNGANGGGDPQPF